MPPQPPRSASEPLTADLRRLHVTVSKRFMEKPEAARDALSHSHPGAEVEAVLEAGLDLLVERAANRSHPTPPFDSRSLLGGDPGGIERGDPLVQ